MLRRPGRGANRHAPEDGASGSFLRVADRPAGPCLLLPCGCDSLAYSALFTGYHRDYLLRVRGCFNAWLKSRFKRASQSRSALRRFKRKVQQEDIVKDIKKHSFYLKPGDKRRAKQALARKRSRKKNPA